MTNELRSLFPEACRATQFRADLVDYDGQLAVLTDDVDVKLNEMLRHVAYLIGRMGMEQKYMHELTYLNILKGDQETMLLY